MIVALGLDIDATFATFVDNALFHSVPLQVVNLRAAVEGVWRFEIPANKAATLDFGGMSVALQPSDSFYCRITELPSSPPNQAADKRWLAFITSLRAWLDDVPGRVVNRPRAGAHNGSKPLHETVIRNLGFRVPPSVTSSEKKELVRFLRAGPAISKPVCGVRADAQICREVDLDGFERMNGPVHLQRYISGADARIHVAGNRIVAQRVSSDHVDYRQHGDIRAMELFTPPRTLSQRVMLATRSLGLEFAGWDFKIDANRNFWCLEVNPMPGYSVYDDQCEGGISQALISHLQHGASAYEARTIDQSA